MVRLHRRALLKMGAVAAGSFASTAVVPQSVSGATGAEWHGFQYDAANTGYNPDGTAPTDGLSQERTYSFPGSTAGAPAVADGKLLVAEREPYEDGATGKLRAFDTTDGSVAWTVEDIGTPDTDAPVVVHDGRVFVTDYGISVLSAVDLETGEVEWGREIGNGSVAYDPANDVVFCGGYGLDPATGETRWDVSPIPTDFYAHAVRDGSLFYLSRYEASPSYGLVSVSTANGAEQWRVSGMHTGAPTATADAVYVPVDYNRVRAYDPDTGTELWTSPVLQDDLISSVVATDNSVYVAYGSVWALDPADGSVMWQVEPEPAPYSSPVVVDGVLYAPAQGQSSNPTILALDATDGSELARVGVDAIGDSVAVADGSIYTAASDVHEVTGDGGGGGGEAVLSLSMSDDTASPGGTTAIEYTLTNTGTAEATGLQGYIDRPSADWRFVSNGNFTSLAPGESETIAVELAVPSDASGSYTFDGWVVDDADHQAYDTATVTVEAAAFDLSAAFVEETVAPGGEATIAVTLENTGSVAGDGTVYFQPAGTGNANTDYYGDDFEVVEHSDDGGDWVYEGWTWTDIGPGETREPTVTLSPSESLAEGTYTFGLSGPGDTVVTAVITVEEETATEIRVKNVRLLQLAEFTRPDMGSAAPPSASNVKPNVPSWSPDPPLVAGKRTVPLFDIETDAAPSTVDTGLDVAISRNSGPTETFSLSPEFVSAALDWSVLYHFVSPGGSPTPSEDLDETYPVISPAGNLSEVTVEVAPTADGYAGDSTTNADISATTGLNLRVGFVRLTDTADRTDFGTVSESDFEETVLEHLTTLQELFPTATVDAYIHDPPVALDGEGRLDWKEYLNLYLDDQREKAYQAVVDEVEDGPISAADGGPPNGDIVVAEDGAVTASTRSVSTVPAPDVTLDDFHGVVAVCPDDFVETMADNSDAQGLEHAGKSGISTLVGASSPPLTTAHELTHHFLGDYETDAFHEDGEAEHAAVDVVSTTVELPSGGTGIPIGEGIERSQFDVERSYMVSTDAVPAADTLTLRRLFDGNFEPASADDGGGWFGSVLSLSATVSTDRIDVVSARAEGNQSATTTEDGDVTVTLRDASGEVLRTVSLSSGVTRGADADEDPETDGTVSISGRIPYPDGTASVEISAPKPGQTGIGDGEHVSTSVNPVTSTFREQLATLPDSAFVSDPGGSRQGLLDHLASASTAMSDGNYAAALDAFEDLESAIAGDVRAGYDPDAANRPSRADLLDEVSSRIDRVERLRDDADEAFDVARFDRDGDGQIDFEEVRAAARARNRGEITDGQFQRVVEAYNTGESV